MPRINSSAAEVPAGLGNFVASPSDLRVSGGIERITLLADYDIAQGYVPRDPRLTLSLGWEVAPKGVMNAAYTNYQVGGVNPAVPGCALVQAMARTAGSTVTIRWRGTGLVMLTAFHNGGGIFTVSNDGSGATTFDSYIPSGAGPWANPVIIASGLVYGDHTTVLTVTGARGGGGVASDSAVFAYGFDILSTTDAVLKYAIGTAYPAGVQTTVNTAGTLSPLTAIGSAPYRRDLIVLDKGAVVPRAIEGSSGSASDTLAQFQAKNQVAYRVEAEDTTGKLANVWYTGAIPDASGYINLGTVHVNDTDSTDYVIVGFIGTGIDLYAYCGGIMGYAYWSIDGGSETQIDLYSAIGVRKWFNLAYNLPYGYHQLKIRKAGAKNSGSSGYFVTLDAFNIYHPTAPTTPVNAIALAEVDVTPAQGWIRLDDAAGWVYTGVNWSVLSGSDSTGGSGRRNLNTNTTDSASVTFFGTQFRLLTNKGSAQGKLNISIDGGADIAVDLYSVSSSAATVSYTSATLPPAVHTVTVKTTNDKNASAIGTNFVLDSIEILPLPVQVRDRRNFAPVDTHTEANRAVVDHVLKYHAGAGQVGMNSNTVNTTSTTFTDLAAFDCVATGRTSATVEVSFVGVISNTSANAIATLQIVNVTTGEVASSLDFTTHSTATRTTSVRLQRAFIVPDGAPHLFRLQAKTASGTLTVQGTMFTESKG